MRQLATMRALGHDPGMNLRVHPKYKTKYRVNNWAEYDRALVRRGDITLWISEDAISSWKPAPAGLLRGAQRKFSDHAIETALTLRLVFNLPLRQAEGFLRSILSLMSIDFESPDHTTLSRRSQNLNVDLHRVACDKAIHLIVDRADSRGRRNTSRLGSCDGEKQASTVKLQIEPDILPSSP